MCRRVAVAWLNFPGGFYSHQKMLIILWRKGNKICLI